MGTDTSRIRDALLAWYDAHAREMPWRVAPADVARGVRPDPYRVWLSEVMLQQTTVAAVRAYHERFTARFPTVEALAGADDAEVMGMWAGLGYYARARNLLACARAVAARGGFPETELELLELPGVGPYTAAAIAAIAFQERAVVVDGNVERVMTRLRAIETPLPAAKPEVRAAMDALTPAERPGDWAQAVMDLGATLCTPKSPSCLLCPLHDACEGRAQGIAADLPRKAPKKAKPTKRGLAYVAVDPLGRWLVETRPPKGMLGGMTGFPTSEWGDDPTPAPPVAADWREMGEVRHGFTHFELHLAVMAAETDRNPERGHWAVPDPDTLPSLFGKVWRVATKRPA
ncbi:A/G-specific adenine glycosylase [Jannaschia sp. Os4]|uniref:A/G-specific adenine glycosylase n=1 Tax=Jannaschia sp. Os4 TaxID=2807617 RepID=UPI001939AAF2|nr:A/G-specific adenine glycosylase [Jannaschia sp. Os4]MBM2575314.1 A/G-specific adenine glycosylase [Jannaschia sp. Os4]